MRNTTICVARPTYYSAIGSEYSKCSHQSEEIRAGDAKCDKTECALYIFLFNLRHWDDKFNDRTHDWCDLAEALGEKSGFGPLTAVRLMADAARHGMQSFIFME